jgi:hypothetical protein
MENINKEMVAEAIKMARQACSETGIKFANIDVMLQSIMDLAGKILIANNVNSVRKEPFGVDGKC